MKCIVVDDNEIVRKQVEAFVQKTGFLSCCGLFDNASKVVSFLEKNDVDLVFLDIEMPQMNGFDFMEKSSSQCQVIVISVSPKYAVDTFDYGVTDYLLKPISYGRFLQAANRAVEKHIANGRNVNELYYKIQDSYAVLPADEIVYLKQKGDKFEVFANSQSVDVNVAVCHNFLEKRADFVRINADIWVNIAKMMSIGYNGKIVFVAGACVGEEIVADSKAVEKIRSLIK
ncbi:MAG: response regulator [Bacteroidales bacterium]|nr:response regulator [Bacteroidales bacterium]